MRDALAEVVLNLRPGPGPIFQRATGSINALPSHFALAYDSLAPTIGRGDEAGRIPVEHGNHSTKQDWLDKLESISIHADYSKAYDRWVASFAHGATRLIRLRLNSRLLIGHGNSSATEVGLSVHHTWGTPILPGSAVKGITAHYTSACVAVDDDADRSVFKGVRRDEYGRMAIAPGRAHAALFGAPDTDDGATAKSGKIVFHDAWYVPGSTPHDKPFALDILTPHQDGYYSQPANRPWPNDYTSPTPVSFITVRPGAQFLLAISAAPGTADAADWLNLAEHLCRTALQEWRVGGKTSAGYGQVETVLG